MKRINGEIKNVRRCSHIFCPCNLSHLANSWDTTIPGLLIYHDFLAPCEVWLYHCCKNFFFSPSVLVSLQLIPIYEDNLSLPLF